MIGCLRRRLDFRIIDFTIREFPEPFTVLYKSAASGIACTGTRNIDGKEVSEADSVGGVSGAMTSKDLSKQCKLPWAVLTGKAMARMHGAI